MAQDAEESDSAAPESGDVAAPAAGDQARGAGPEPNEEYARELVDEIGGPLVLFDGVCEFCNSYVDFVVERDSEGEFKFAAIQSDAGQVLCERLGVDPDHPSSFVLVDEDGVHTRSSGALRLFRRIGLPYSTIYLFALVPRRARDRVYDVVAKRRYRIKGRRDECRVPDEGIRGRFVDVEDLG